MWERKDVAVAAEKLLEEVQKRKKEKSYRPKNHDDHQMQHMKRRTPLQDASTTTSEKT